MEWDKRDRYNRIEKKVLPTQEDINLRQVLTRLAWHYKKYTVEQSAADRQLYAEAETEARDAARSLWKEPSPVPPWEWQRGVR